MTFESISNEPKHPFEDEIMLGIEFGQRECLSAREVAACKEYINMLEACAQDPDLFIGKGGAGKVWAIHETGFCLKVVKNRPNATPDGLKFNVGNSAESEARFQFAAQRVRVGGARVPVCVRVLQGGDYSGIVMEQLNAVNLEEVLLGLKPLPEVYDHDTFFDALGAFLEELHTDCGVLHGDLEARNIMIDIESGAPYVIDFGRSEALPKEEREKRAKVKIDWDTYDKVEEQMYALNERRKQETNNN